MPHGIGRHKGDDTVSLRALQAGQFLRLEARNLNSSLEDLPSGLLGRGVGLANTRARLEQLYGSRQDFRIGNLEPTGVCATFHSIAGGSGYAMYQDLAIKPSGPIAAALAHGGRPVG
jgi:LytS/YehU family sensor histidine kinase